MKVPEEFHREVDALRKRAELALEQFKLGNDDMYFLAPEIQTVADELAALDTGGNPKLAEWAMVVSAEILACIGSASIRMDEPMDREEVPGVVAEICEALSSVIYSIDSPENI